VGIVKGYLESLLVLGKEAELQARKSELDTLLRDYADAIHRNLHFIALSKNVEEFMAVCRTMSAAFPQDQGFYNQMSATALADATREREKMTARPPSFLW
jgi:hypothetical protein